jgi:hypothetical protein
VMRVGHSAASMAFSTAGTKAVCLAVSLADKWALNSVGWMDSRSAASKVEQSAVLKVDLWVACWGEHWVV